jgi:hypothetical protein
MPSRAKSKSIKNSFADAYAAVAQHLQTQLGDNLAVQAGPPTSIPVTPTSDRQKAEAWNTPHPAATDEAMWSLAQQKYAEHRGAGLPEEQAIAATSEDLTHFRYRARQPLYTLGTTSWDEQVKEARRLARLADKQGEEQAAPQSQAKASPTPELAAQSEMPEPTTGAIAAPTEGTVPARAGPEPQGGLTSGY